MASPHRPQSICLGLLLVSGSGYLAAQETPAATPPVRLHIDSQPLPQALTALATQTGVQLVYHPEDISAGVISPAVSGSYTADKALTKILDSSGLSFYHVNSNTIAIRLARAERSASEEGGPKGSGTQHLAAVDTEGGGAENTAAEAGTGKRKDLAEVIVSAEKRDERLQDVPVPVTAVSADTLLDSNQLRLKDYYTNIPGFSVTPRGVGALQTLAIRGITTGNSTNPTVGITIDDVPYGSSTGLGGGAAAPDIDPGDLARIEVLRGPQGTLYGASSIGGLLKFVTVDPSTDGFSGRVQVDGNGVYRGSQPGYGFRGSINVPITDTFAIRASGFTRQDPGYIDNPILNMNGVNEDHVNGGRLSGLWKPSEVFSLKFSALYQDARMHGSSDVDVEPGLGDLQQNYLPGIGKGERKVQAYSAIAKAKLGTFEVTSLSGYNVNEFTDSFDYSYALGTLTKKLFGVNGTPLTYDNNTRKFSQELRATTPLGTHVDWLFGLFYTHENTQYVQDLLAQAPTTTQIVGQWGTISFPSTYQEYAAFTDLTFKLTDQFDVQVGGRESHIHETSSEGNYGTAYDTLFLGKPSPVIYPETVASGNAFTYLVTPRFKFTSDLMLYARLASGYRAGGTNAAPGVPREYAPDKTQNYELGFKGEFFDHALTVDSSLYYIDWKDIQLQLSNPANKQSYDANASRAKSEGVELSLTARPVTGLSLATWVTYDNAVLTDGFPPTSTAYGVSGNRLPNTSRWSGNFSVEQDFPLVGSATGFVGAAASYVGDRLGIFGTVKAPARQVLAAYTKIDVRAGVNYDTWAFNFFVNNVADQRGVLAGGLGTNDNPAAFIYLQPRTVGLSVTKSF